ncbi:MAG: hypothetical protein ACK4NF_03100, partial [Planctomycetota bacterium]
MKIENIFFLFLIPVLVLLFILDRNKQYKVIHKLSTLKIIEKWLINSPVYIEKVLLYLLLFSLVIVMSGIAISFTGSRKKVIIINVPFLTDETVAKITMSVSRYLSDNEKFVLYLNNIRKGEYTISQLKNLADVKVSGNFHLRNIVVDSVFKEAGIYLVKFCRDAGIINDKNISRICIAGIDNVGFVEAVEGRAYLFNYSGSDKQITIKTNTRLYPLLVKGSTLATILFSHDDEYIKIVEKDVILEDNDLILQPVKVFVENNLNYTRKSIEALGIKTYTKPENEKFDLCIIDSSVRPSNYDCKIVFILASSHRNTWPEIFTLQKTELNEKYLVVKNLILPSIFDINKITLSKFFTIAFNDCKRIVPFIINKEDTNIMFGYCDKDAQKFVVSSINWEETQLTDFANNMDAPLPVFIDAVFKYLFKEQTERVFSGKALFSYYNDDF